MDWDRTGQANPRRTDPGSHPGNRCTGSFCSLYSGWHIRRSPQSDRTASCIFPGYQFSVQCRKISRRCYQNRNHTLHVQYRSCRCDRSICKHDLPGWTDTDNCCYWYCCTTGYRRSPQQPSAERRCKPCFFSRKCKLCWNPDVGCPDWTCFTCCQQHDQERSCWCCKRTFHSCYLDHQHGTIWYLRSRVQHSIYKRTGYLYYLR